MPAISCHFGQTHLLHKQMPVSLLQTRPCLQSGQVTRYIPHILRFYFLDSRISAQCPSLSHGVQACFSSVKYIQGFVNTQMRRCKKRMPRPPIGVTCPMSPFISKNRADNIAGPRKLAQMSTACIDEVVKILKANKE